LMPHSNKRVCVVSVLVAALLACDENQSPPVDAAADIDTTVADAAPGPEAALSDSAGTDGPSSDIGPCGKGTYSAPNGSVVVNTPTDLESLRGYSAVSGDVWIYCTTCTNVEALSCLKTVDGHLTFGKPASQPAALVSLSGLSNLTTVTGQFELSSAKNLPSLAGLDHLQTVGGQFRIADLDSITNVDGLGSLTSIGEDLYIEVNDKLTNLNGLSKLTAVSGNVSIGYNIKLPNCEAHDLVNQLTGFSGKVCIHFNHSDSCPDDVTGC